QEIMYEIAACPLPIARPPLLLDCTVRSRAAELVSSALPRHADSDLIGINVGSGARWPKKMLDAVQIADLCIQLMKRNDRAHLLLLGGSQEERKIAQVLKLVGRRDHIASAGTTHNFLEFAALIERCKLVITGDTLALHLATAFAIPTVALFGPTSVA